METHDSFMNFEFDSLTFNFLASLINGNAKLDNRSISVSSSSFNFLASLINGNHFTASIDADDSSTYF